jgi:hypothetical protein
VLGAIRKLGKGELACGGADSNGQSAFLNLPDLQVVATKPSFHEWLVGHELHGILFSVSVKNN